MRDLGALLNIVSTLWPEVGMLIEFVTLANRKQLREKEIHFFSLKNLVQKLYTLNILISI